MEQFIQLENFTKILPYAQLFRQGMLVTVLLSLFTVVIGFCIALILALMRMSNVRPLRSLGLDQNGHLREGGFLALISKFNPLSFLATAYVEILRSTPVIVQIFNGSDRGNFGDYREKKFLPDRSALFKAEGSTEYCASNRRASGRDYENLNDTIISGTYAL